MKLGIVLSGGASKCIAHLGVLQAFDEMGIKPDVISAVSGGALLGSMYAAGMKPKEILDITVKKADFSFYFPSIRTGGFLSMSRLTDLYAEELPVKTFEELKIPMIINATDILKGEIKYFSKGELLPPIIASSSYPIIFEPIEIDGSSYLDGGIMNNFPIEPIKNDCDIIIGCSVGKVHHIEKIGSVKRIIFRSLELAINENDLYKLGQVDYLIEPDGLGQFGMFDFGAGEDIFQLGYKDAMARAKSLEKLLFN